MVLQCYYFYGWNRADDEAGIYLGALLNYSELFWTSFSSKKLASDNHTLVLGNCSSYCWIKLVLKSFNFLWGKLIVHTSILFNSKIYGLYFSQYAEGSFFNLFRFAKYHSCYQLKLLPENFLKNQEEIWDYRLSKTHFRL